MRYRRLGNLSYMVSEIGLGTAQLSNTDSKFHGVKYVSLQEARRILSFAIDNGVNFFDTADHYGDVELLFGELPLSIKSKILIATKAGLRLDGIRDFSDSYLRQQVDRSLQRLATNRLDLFQLNKPSVEDLKDDRLFVLLNSLKQAGKIKYGGIVVGDVSTGDICLKSGCVDCIQVMYNLLYNETLTLIAKAGLSGVGVIVRSPLNSGVLSGAYTPETVFPNNDERSRYFSGRQFQERLARLRKIQADIPVSNENLLEFSLQYILSNHYVSVVIPGASSVAQAERYISCSGRAEFSEPELARIRKIISRHMMELKQDFQNLGNVKVCTPCAPT